MGIIIRVALVFFFVQFLVVMTIMTVAVLLARLEIAGWCRAPGHETLKRSLSVVVHLPSRIFRAVARLVYSIHSLRRSHP